MRSAKHMFAWCRTVPYGTPQPGRHMRICRAYANVRIHVIWGCAEPYGLLRTVEAKVRNSQHKWRHARFLHTAVCGIVFAARSVNQAMHVLFMFSISLDTRGNVHPPTPSISLRHRDDHGNGIPIENGNPMGMGHTSSQLWEWKWERIWIGITAITMGNDFHRWPQSQPVCIVAEFGGPNLKGRYNILIQQAVCCFCTAICRNHNWTLAFLSTILNYFDSLMFYTCFFATHKLGMGIGRYGNRLHGSGKEWQSDYPFPVRRPTRVTRWILSFRRKLIVKGELHLHVEQIDIAYDVAKIAGCRCGYSVGCVTGSVRWSGKLEMTSYEMTITESCRVNGDLQCPAADVTGRYQHQA